MATIIKVIKVVMGGEEEDLDEALKCLRSDLNMIELTIGPQSLMEDITPPAESKSVVAEKSESHASATH